MRWALAAPFAVPVPPIIEGFCERPKPSHAMPIYAYKCASCGFAKDVLQKISDAPLTTCPSCGQEAFGKQVTAAGFQLKGSGWYVTDFRDGNKGKDAKATPDKPASGADAGTAPAGGADAAAKPADKPESAKSEAPKVAATPAPPSTPSTGTGS